MWDERTMVRTHGPRGTVHLLPTADLPMWMRRPVAPSRTRPRMPPTIRLDDDQVDAVVAAAADAVAEDDLTLDELDDGDRARCGAWAVELVMPAFQTVSGRAGGR